MFIITPKQPKRAPAGAVSGVPDVSAEVDRGPVRSTTACDSCRVRKTKCNGQQPCGRCKSKRVICVYSRPTNRETPISPAQVSLLQHQQRRLCKAVQEMAAVIAQYESGSDRAPSSFIVSELLEKYAPPSVYDAQGDNEDLALQGLNEVSPPVEPRISPVKREYEDDEATARSSKRRCSDDTPFEIRPAGGWVGDSEQQRQAYQTMIQFMQSMNRSEPDSSSMMTAAATTATMPASNTGFDQTASQSYTYPATLDSQAAFTNPPPSFTDLVDWDMSLENVMLSLNQSVDDQWTTSSNSDFNNPSGTDMMMGNMISHESRQFNQPDT